MTAEQVVAQLRAIRYGRVTLRGLARHAGVDHVTLYDAINTGRISPQTRDRLASALQSVDIVRGNNVSG